MRRQISIKTMWSISAVYFDQYDHTFTCQAIFIWQMKGQSRHIGR